MKRTTFLVAAARRVATPFAPSVRAASQQTFHSMALEGGISAWWHTVCLVQRRGL